MKKTIQTFKLIVLSLVLSFGISYAFAWTAPTATPPSGNIAAPLNTGVSAQTKVGALTVNGSLSAPTLCLGGVCRSIWPSGNVIDTLSSTLLAGNNAGSQSITGVASLTANGTISVPTLCLNGDCKSVWPISGGGNIIDTLSSTLTAGNNAGGLNILNVGQFSSGYIQSNGVIGAAGTIFANNTTNAIVATGLISTTGNITAASIVSGNAGVLSKGIAVCQKDGVNCPAVPNIAAVLTAGNSAGSRDLVDLNNFSAFNISAGVISAIGDITSNANLRAASSIYANGVVSGTVGIFSKGIAVCQQNGVNCPASVSTRDFKDNVATIKDALEKVLSLRGVTFNWNDKAKAKFPNIEDKAGMGLIAEEVETQFPELVKNVDGVKTLQYELLVAPMIETIKFFTVYTVYGYIFMSSNI